MRTTKLLLVPPLLGLFFVTSGLAGTTAPEEPAISQPARAESEWWSRALLYTWVTAIEGDVGILGLSSPLDISMSDTLESLDLAYMGTFEAGRGRASLGIDVIYAKSTDDVALLAGPFDAFRFVQEQWVLTPFAAYRAIETDRHRLDFYGGVRITLIEADLTGFLTTGGGIPTGGQVDIYDPMIGLRGQSRITEKIAFRYNGDIGGFGVDSDLNWQAFAGFAYDLTANSSIGIGYRAMGIDYSKDSFTMDTVTHGPALGLEMRW